MIRQLGRPYLSFLLIEEYGVQAIISKETKCRCRESDSSVVPIKLGNADGRKGCYQVITLTRDTFTTRRGRDTKWKQKYHCRKATTATGCVFIHATTNSQTHAFKEHVKQLANNHQNIKSFVIYDAPTEADPEPLNILIKKDTWI